MQHLRAVALILLSASPVFSYANGYSWRATLTIDHTKIPSTQTGFPVLISSTDANLATVANGGKVESASGYDIAFYAASDGAGTKLDHEIGTWVATTGAIVAWVRIASLSSSVDTVIYVFAGNASIGASQQHADGVWSSGFKSVYHFPDGSTLTANDSTSNANNITNYGATATAGITGGGAAFSSQYMTAPFVSGMDGNAQTISVWFKSSTTGAYQELLRRDDALGGKRNWLCRITNGNKLQGVLIWGGYPALTSAADVTDGNWHLAHFVFSYDGVDTNAVLYLDGQSVATGSTGGAQPATSQLVDIGSYMGPPRAEYLAGSLDELRLSAVNLPAGWITAEYNNQSNPSAFYGLGSWAQDGGAQALAPSRRITIY